MSVPYIRGVAKQAQDDPTMSESVEGRVFRPMSEGELAEAVDKAFDYRGDVTLGLASGESIQGYLFNQILYFTQNASVSIFFRWICPSSPLSTTSLLPPHGTCFRSNGLFTEIPGRFNTWV